MKRLLVLITLLLAMALSGCTTFNVATSQPDGTFCKASYSSLFKAFDSANGTACGASGTAENSQSDQLSTALTGALIRGLNPQ